ncbi:MAG: bacteriocin family protein [Acidobacteria bacterium]|nr:bacteriocin family protein [Acidobacteriota bacterium]
MNNNLGRDKIFNPAVWDALDKGVNEAFGLVRVAQKVFPSLVLENNPSNVPADVYDPATGTTVEGETKKLFEVRKNFSLTQSQVDAEETLKTAQKVAKLNARLVAFVEDMILFQGRGVVLPDGVEVDNLDAAGVGLLGEATTIKSIIPVPPLDPSKPGIYGVETFKAVAKGIAELVKRYQPAPYALILESMIFADTHAPTGTNTDGSLATTYDRILPLVTGGFYSTGALPAFTGLLVSLPGDPTRLCYGLGPVTGYAQEDPDGKHLFFLKERVQSVVMDRRSLVKLEFGKGK